MFLFPLVTIRQTEAQAQQSSQVPKLEFQKEYGNGNYNTAAVSNLIQTSDGGYAFLDGGYFNGFGPDVGSTLYKVNSTGGIEWTLYIDLFQAISLIKDTK